MKRTVQRLTGAMLGICLPLGLLSCGAETAAVVAGISGTGIAMGTVDGFGSIYVNGIEYDIDDATMIINGTEYSGQAGQDRLAIGMVVILEHDQNNDGTGIAYRVSYDESVQGPIANLQTPVDGDTSKISFDILGQSVVVDELSTSFSGSYKFSQIQENDVVEISGFVDSQQIVHATWIELKQDSGTGFQEVQLHGTVSNLVAGVSFTLNGITVDLSSTTLELEDLSEGLANSILIEVQGDYDADNQIIYAQSIEGEDDDRSYLNNSDKEISLHGVVSDLTESAMFSLNGVQVDASGLATALTDQLANGIEIEVEGQFVNGVLVATELEFRSGETEWKLQIQSVDLTQSSIGLGLPNTTGELTVTIDAQSQLEDELEVFEPLKLQQLAAGMNVAVELIGSYPQWTVKSLKRIQGEKFELQGSVSALDENQLQMYGLSINLADSIEIDGADQLQDLIDLVSTAPQHMTLIDEDRDGLIDKLKLEDEEEVDD